MLEQNLLDCFKKRFGDTSGVKLYFAPGRVNLIGEHTDYNGGYVFPCALTMGTYAVARKRTDHKIRLFSENFSDFGIRTFYMDELIYDKKDSWTNYPKGVIDTLKKKGYDISNGLDILYYGDIPNSSGLSSSASIEVLTAFICKKLFGLSFDMVECSKLCQYSENNFNGVNCGIMDQFAIAMGKKGHAIFLDTSVLQYEYAKFNLSDTRIVIMNTNKKRGLGDSKYNERRSQCEEALRQLQTKLDIYSLGDLNQEQWTEYNALIKNELLRKRARHAVMENQRTILAVKALKENNIKQFGKWMNDSHDSLRDDYEVTGIELDTLVEEAKKCEGVLGARMTGAGFGGCAISIVQTKYIDSLIQRVGDAYQKNIGYKADFYVVEIGDGPKECEV